jgi:hypothetical protein
MAGGVNAQKLGIDRLAVAINKDHDPEIMRHHWTFERRNFCRPARGHAAVALGGTSAWGLFLGRATLLRHPLSACFGLVAYRRRFARPPQPDTARFTADEMKPYRRRKLQ